MRNYLLFDDFIDKNNLKKLNNIYINYKKKYIKDKNKLNALKKNINLEKDYFKNILKKINNDFNTYKSNLNNTDLVQQYKTIINNTDNYYLDKIQEINYAIYLEKKNSEIFIKVLKKILRFLKNHNNKTQKLYKSIKNIKTNKTKN